MERCSEPTRHGQTILDRKHVIPHTTSKSQHGGESMIDPVAVEAAFVTTLAGAAATTRWALNNFQSWHKDRRDLGASRRLLLADSGVGDTAYRSENAHDLWLKAGPSAENAIALTTAAGSRYDIAKRKGLLRVEEGEFILTDMRRDIVLLGSPASEAISQAVFGYEREDDGSLVLQGKVIDLPYYWALDRDPSVPGVRRYIDGALVYRPNWYLRGNASDGTRLLIPAADADTRLLKTDYLVVTRLRNFIDDYRAGYYIVNIGGTHGTGTRAIYLALRSAPIARKLFDQLGQGCTAFQAVFEVEVRHDHASAKSWPADISLVYATALRDSEAVWAAAHSAIELSGGL